MKIGIASPFELQMLEKYLYEKDSQELNKINGLGGTQPTQLAMQFLNMGYEVSLFTLSQSIPVGEYKVLSGKNLKIYIGHFRRGKQVTLDFQYKEIKQIKEMILVDKPDILSAQWTYEFAFASLLSKIPTIITVRDWSPEIFKLTKKPYRFMRMLMSFFVYYKGNNFIANSPYIDQKLKFLQSKKIGILPNGIQDSIFLSIKKEFDISNEFNIISINNGFGERKNLKPLIKAFINLVTKYKNLHLYLIGDGFGQEQLAYQWCRDNSLLSNIHFVGKVNYTQVIQCLDMSDLMVHPALEESFGNILVEAMARRVPVIAGKNSGAVPWVVRESGLLVNVSDEGSIEKSIEEFIKNPEKLVEYSEKGYQNAYSRFRLSNIANQYIKKFNEILGEKVDK